VKGSATVRGPNGHRSNSSEIEGRPDPRLETRMSDGVPDGRARRGSSTVDRMNACQIYGSKSWCRTGCEMGCEMGCSIGSDGGPDTGPDGGETGCQMGPDGVLDGARRGARRGQTGAMSSATSFLNAMFPV
jgi:hypothetical protein